MTKEEAETLVRKPVFGSSQCKIAQRFLTDFHAVQTAMLDGKVVPAVSYVTNEARLYESGEWCFGGTRAQTRPFRDMSRTVLAEAWVCLPDHKRFTARRAFATMPKDDKTGKLR